jgi:flagellar biosynthesis protein FlhG
LRVTLVDVDMGLANIDVLMNVRAPYTLSHVLSNLRTLREVAVGGPCGLRFVPGASGLHEMADLSEFERQSLIAQLQTLEINTDIMVLDCGAGIGRNVLSFALAADRVVVVTTPQPPALTDAYAMIKALHLERYRGRLGLFVNMADSRLAALEAHRRVATVAHRFLNFLVAEDGYMLHDTAVELAVLERCPFVLRDPSSNAAACVAAMADEVARSVSGQQRRGGFFSRVAGLFA